MPQQKIYSVSSVNRYIKDLMDDDTLLSGIYVRGEISNYKVYPSGHHYFSLKDAEGSIRCVMFRREADNLKFRPQNGMKVIAFGRISVFPRDGQYQLYCSQLVTDGMGDLHIAFEQLKEKLYKEGLFEPSRKRPLPKFPEKIALITSPAGAAVQDMLRILEARWPLTQIIIVPVKVQGEGSAGEIAAALHYVNAKALADVIITGRGGGSMEDLWAFNEEIVARAIARSEIPVISAVGHEPDVTIADFVADLRAATPSNAAELVVPDQNEIYGQLQQINARVTQSLTKRLMLARQQLNRMEQSRSMSSPENYVEGRRMLLDFQHRRLLMGFRQMMSGDQKRLAGFAASLDALSPLKVLARGYAIPQNADGIIRSVKSVAEQEQFDLRMNDGSLRCEILKVKTE
jgi:exodeoxyribonuclease VII large subunit